MDIVVVVLLVVVLLVVVVVVVLVDVMVVVVVVDVVVVVVFSTTSTLNVFCLLVPLTSPYTYASMTHVHSPPSPTSASLNSIPHSWLL